MAYVLTASRASSIRLACKANFLSSKQETLITVSSNVLSIHQTRALAAAQEIVCYGRLATVTPFRPAGESLDHLLLTTEDHKYFTLAYIDGKIVTGASGDFSTEGLVPPETGQKVIANKEFVILYLFNGIVTLLPLRNTKNPRKRSADGNKLFGEPVQLRLNELKVHDIAMLDQSRDNKTIFGILYRDQQLVSQFKSYEVALHKGEYELRSTSDSIRNLEHGTTMIIPNGAEAIYCIGESSIYAKSAGKDQAEYPLSVPTLFNSKALLPDGNWILGDDYGLLYKLDISNHEPLLTTLTSPALLSIPSVLVSLGTDELFLGSHYGDSQLLAYPSLEVKDTKVNIGPVQDILVQPPQGAGGSSSLITASGAYKDGSLRLVKYGVGMAASAELDIPGIRGIWGIDELSIIVVSFVNSYLVLHVSDDGDFEQIDAGEESILYACAIKQNLHLVLRSGVRICSNGVTLRKHPFDEVILAKHFDNQIFILSGSKLLALTFRDEEIVKSVEKTFDEISAFEVAQDALIIGFWNSNILWIGDHQFEKLAEERFEEGTVPSSIVLQQFNGIDHRMLLVGMNDGSMLSYSFADNALTGRKQTILGATPVILHSFKTRQGPNVFAVSDRPTIIYTLRAKLSFSGINISSCDFFSSFNSTVLQSCMIISTDKGLRIGNIDDIQRLQFKSAPLGELPRRLLSACGYICALTMRLEVEEVTGNEMQRSYLKLFDADSLELQTQYELKETEMCQSLCRLTHDDQEWIVVGTSFADNEEDECSRGRILIFGVHKADASLWVYKELDVPGSVYCIASSGSRLVAGVNSFVRLFDVTQSGGITQIGSHRSSTFAITIAARDAYVLVGDLMKSVTYLKITPGEGLVEVSRDYVPTWMTSVNFFAHGTFIGSEAEGNIVMLRESDSPLEENKFRLDRIGEYKVGEMINKIVTGVITQPEESSGVAIVVPHSLYGTVDGSIGILGKIQDGEWTGLLMMLQSNIATVRPSVGGLSHALFRAYRCAGARNTEPNRIVDGDLIEEFLDLTPEQQETAVQGTGKSVAEVEKIVEDLSRLR